MAVSSAARPNEPSYGARMEELVVLGIHVRRPGGRADAILRALARALRIEPFPPGTRGYVQVALHGDPQQVRETAKVTLIGQGEDALDHVVVL
jgi:hypothetical protein